VDLNQVLEYLALEQEINEVLVEAGPALTGNMIKQTLVDELVIYAAPKLMGQSGRELFTLAEFTSMQECPELSINDIRKIGDDVRITATFENRQ
ncbi:MAG: dihydrofolate reductase family protein, partial [Gammaproteobacteria bacterium]|nr:dihydrofolate reductase family protein [Gammaproteobacteria bacterium]